MCHHWDTGMCSNHQDHSITHCYCTVPLAVVHCPRRTWQSWPRVCEAYPLPSPPPQSALPQWMCWWSEGGGMNESWALVYTCNPSLNITTYLTKYNNMPKDTEYIKACQFPLRYMRTPTHVHCMDTHQHKVHSYCSSHNSPGMEYTTMYMYIQVYM